MKICTQNNNVNFGSKRLFSVKLAKRSILGYKKYVDAFVSELEKPDRENLLKIQSEWDKTKYGGRIIHNFINETEYINSQIGKNKRYYVIEVPDKKGEMQIKALTLAEVSEKSVYVSFLQAQKKSKLYFKNFKGLGSCLMYAIVDMTNKTKDRTSVHLYSAEKAVNFYKKIGFDYSFLGDYFCLSKFCFQEFMDKMKKKFHITPAK